jgi:threonine synthase
MKWISTRGVAPPVSFREALVAGLAPDGGLYVPESIPSLSRAQWSDLADVPLADTATAMLTPFLADDLPAATLHQVLLTALDFPTPIVPLDDRVAVLELFHGPTFAFKDVGARVLARLMSQFHGEGQPPLTVLVATSGDTGGAVAQAFFGVPRTRVVVLYPEGQVSAVQEAQFTTLGGNVTAIAVAGTFDDCQRLVKQAFGSAELRARAHLTSANSISLGRLLPQMSYYGHAAVSRWVKGPLTIVVPSGNFGNVAAGLMARQMGAPIAHFHAATNVNDTVPRYLESGTVEPRPSVSTLANAMDVGDPSNLERIRWMFGDRAADVKQAMSASVHTDDDVRAAIAELERQHGYVADPHTAIAYHGARACLRTGRSQVLLLSTAHPAKFADVVEAAIGRRVEIPAALAVATTRPRQIQRIAPQLDALAQLL